MPCPGSGSTASLDTGKQVKDYHGLHPYTPPDGIFKPSTRADLVSIVQMIEGKVGKAKAIGSVWSLSTAPDSDGFVIDTSGLNRHLSQPFAFPTPPGQPGTPLVVSVLWDPSRFATPAHNAQWLATLARPGFPQAGGILIHVQAGIQIKTLLEDLASVGLALPTMGAAGGQSLAGALSTATHGSDVNLSLLGDAVRAVHLIGPGGQEWWIQSNDGYGSETHYSQLPDWCHDTKVVRDTDFLQSVVVGVGRFGIVYSMVLEVVPQYLLEEETEETTWTKIRTVLLAAVTAGYTTDGNVFADPRNGSALRHWMVFVDPASGSRAWRTRRWLTSNAKEEGLDKGFELLGYLCTHSDAAKTAATVATGVLVGAITGMIAAIWSTAGLIPIGGAIGAANESAPLVALITKLIGAMQNFSTLGTFLAAVLDVLRKSRNLASSLIDDAITKISGEILSSQANLGLRRGPSNKILDGHNYALDHCYSGDSGEFFFDAATVSYIQFVDDVLQKARDLGPIVGYVSLRFVRETMSKLGMERFPLTVAIEVTISRPGSVNNEYVQSVEALAFKHGGIPHWGQEHSLNKIQVEQLYKDRLEPWRWALAETEMPLQGTFSSAFTRERGLEVNRPLENLDTHRARRYVAAIISGAS
jgi:hypothetical protein